MTNKYKQWGRGTGWWGESERHRLARLGFKTGTKLPERKLPPYLDPIAHMPMSWGWAGKGFVKRRGDREKVLEHLEKHGWKVRKISYMAPGGAFEAWRGKNYLLLTHTHWGKLEVEEAFIRDKDVGERLKTVLRKPYPYKVHDYSKNNNSQQIENLLKIDKTRKVQKTSHGQLIIHGGKSKPGVKGTLPRIMKELDMDTEETQVRVYEKHLHPAGTFNDLFKDSNHIEIVNILRGNVVRELTKKDSKVTIDPKTGNPGDIIEVDVSDELLYEPWLMDRGSIVFQTQHAPPGLKGQLLKLATEGDIVRKVK